MNIFMLNLFYNNATGVSLLSEVGLGKPIVSGGQITDRYNLPDTPCLKPVLYGSLQTQLPE